MPRRSPRWHAALAALFCTALVLSPSLAEARAGSSSGFGHATPGIGSRGTRTFEPNGAQPITRSATPAPAPHAAAPVGPSPAYGGSFFQRHPFLTGLFGGFLGSWLFHGLGGMGHALGTLVTLLIFGFLVYLAVRWLTGRSFSFAGAGMPRSVGAAATPAPSHRGTEIGVGEADLNAFEAIHAAVQEAWSRGDLARMRQLMTPEMVGYFSEELTRNASQGVQNLVSEVRLLKGEISESWEEGDLQYATAYLRWSAIDYVVRIGAAPGAPDYLVSGDPRAAVEAEEVWTFVRRRGGSWLLSAIQQV